MEKDIQNSIDVKDLPFNVKGKGEWVEISSKPQKNLSKKEKKTFEKDKVIVRVHLWSNEELERLSSIQPTLIEEDKNSFEEILHRIKQKIWGMLLS